MKLYPVPGGTWAGTEADWKKALKALGLDPKNFEASKTREVPTGKKELMEWLTFYSVDVYRLGDGGIPAPAPAVDVDALRAQHNPTPAEQVRDAVGTTGDAPTPTPTDSTADRQLAAMENPGVDIDALCEFTTNAKGYALKRIAGAVAAAFGRLAAD